MNEWVTMVFVEQPRLHRLHLERHSDVFSTLYILRVLKSDLQKSKYYDIPHFVLVMEPCYGLSGFLAESSWNIRKNIEAPLSIESNF